MAPFETPNLIGKAILDNGARMKLERWAIREITAALQEQLKNALRGDKTPSVMRDKLNKYGKPLQNALRRTLLDGAMLGVASLMERLAAPVKAIPEEIQFSGVDWEMVNEEVRDWVLGPDVGDIPIGEKPAGYLGELYDQINQTSGKTLRTYIANWIESGEHLDMLKKDLEPMFGKTRAELIASTEVTRAYTLGNQKAWKASGLIDMPLPGEYSPPLHPRCILPGNEVVALGPISGAAKSFYVGDAIEITTENGSILTVTQNHHIATTLGWVQAKFLAEGDYVLSTPDTEGVVSRVDPDNNNRPAMVEDVFSSLEMTGVSTVVKPLPIDFYGDAEFFKGDVHIVGADGFLWRDSQPFASKRIAKTGFQDSLKREVGLERVGSFAPFSEGALSPLTGNVSGGELSIPLGGGHCGPLDTFSFGPVSGSDTSREQSLSDTTPSDAEKLGQLVLGCSGLIEPDKIININRFAYTGHVYDLQCDMFGLYIIQGVLVKNCRCTTDVSELEPGVWHHIFLTAVDDRVCPICGPLHNTSVGIAKILPQAQEPVAGAGGVTSEPGVVVPKEIKGIDEAIEWSSSNYGEWEKSLGFYEDHTTRSYTETLYRQLNSRLREVGGDLSQITDEYFVKKIQEMDTAIAKAKAPKGGIRVFRAVGRGGDIDWESKIGEFITEDAYSSTSVLRDKALRHAKKIYDKDPMLPQVIVDITVPEGYNAASVMNISKFQKEAEVVLRRSSRFKITGAETGLEHEGMRYTKLFLEVVL